MRLSTAPLLSALIALPLALACGDKGDDSGTADGGSTDGGTEDGGSTGDGGTPEGGSLTGRVLTEDGSGASVQVRLCADLCRTAMTDESGTYEYLGVEADHYALEAVYLTDQNGFATPLDFVTLAEDEERTLSADMVIYEFATKVELTGGVQEVAVDGGLTLTVDPDALTASAANSPVLDESTPDYVAGVQVDPSAIGLELEEIESDVVAAWFMGRMSVVSDPPTPFVSTELYGLAEGESVSIVGSDYDSKHWLDGGTATVTDGQLVSDSGSGIPVFSTVLFLAN